MEIGDQRADVTGTVAPAEFLLAQLPKIILIVLWKIIRIRFVHGINCSAFGHPDVFVTENISADSGIERKTEDPMAGGVDQHGRRSVDDVSCRNLPSTALQDRGAVLFFGRRATENGEDGSHVDVHVDIGRAVEGIENDGVFATLRCAIERDRLLVLLETRTATLSRSPRQCISASFA